MRFDFPTLIVLPVLATGLVRAFDAFPMPSSCPRAFAEDPR